MLDLSLTGHKHRDGGILNGHMMGRFSSSNVLIRNHSSVAIGAEHQAYQILYEEGALAEHGKKKESLCQREKIILKKE